MSFSGLVSLYSFNILFLTQVITVLTSTIRYNEFLIDKGKNITIPCDTEGAIMWVKESGNDTIPVAEDEALVLVNVSESDSGVYFCLTPVSNDTDDSDDLNMVTFNDTQYYPHFKTLVKVRTAPGPVTELYFKASTILGFLVWRFNKTNSGGYPVKSFTAEYRNISQIENVTYEWIRLDPINISPNVRQMEIYHLLPNTSYEFRIWANNYLGSGKIVTTNVTTLPETDERDLIRLIMADAEHFDPRVWIVAVSIVLGTLTILAVGLCILLAKECHQAQPFVDEDEDGWESIEIVPNIILNPGFCESDDHDNTPYTRTIIFGEDDESDGYDDEEEEPMTFKRKVSIFFTGHTIKRI